MKREFWAQIFYFNMFAQSGVLIAGLLLSANVTALPMLTYENDAEPMGFQDVVTGATGFEVDGMLFSMTFQDGSCIELFDGCDSLTDFDVGGTGATTQSTLTAEFFRLFVEPVRARDMLTEDLDSFPSQAIGCTNLGFCETRTPIDSNGRILLVGRLVNGSLDQLDYFDVVHSTSNLASPSHSSASSITSNWAVWTKDSNNATVSEPRSLTLLMAGLIGLLSYRRAGAR